MTQTRPITSLIGDTQGCPRVEFMTGRWAIWVNAATDLAADLSLQGDTTRRGVIGAFHAHELRGQRYRHLSRHASPTDRLGKLRRMKIHAVAGTTGAAMFADRLR